MIATTESPLDDLKWHRMIRDSGWNGRVVTAYRPDAVVDPEFEGFAANLDQFGEITGCDTGNWAGYLDAHRRRRAFFKEFGATATDHGHPTAETENLPSEAAEELFDRVRRGTPDEREKRLFRAPDADRDGAAEPRRRAGAADPSRLMAQPLRRRSSQTSAATRASTSRPAPTMSRAEAAARRVGTAPDLTIIVFTLDETSYARELAPLAGVYPALRLGPAWWFHDSPEGMRRFRELTTETAGFYNTVGFNDDTRAFLSIPARHDMARRVDCAFLARSRHRASAARGRGPRGRAATSPIGSPRRRTGSRQRARHRKREETDDAFIETGGGHAGSVASLTIGAAGAQTVLRSSDTHPDGYPTVEAVKYMGELVEERTGGRYRCEVFHSAQLGEEKDTIEQTRFGVIDLNRISMAPFNGLIPETTDPVAALSLPRSDRPHAQGARRPDRRADPRPPSTGRAWSRSPSTTAAPAPSTTARSRSTRSTTWRA